MNRKSKKKCHARWTRKGKDQTEKVITDTKDMVQVTVARVTVKGEPIEPSNGTDKDCHGQGGGNSGAVCPSKSDCLKDRVSE